MINMSQQQLTPFLPYINAILTALNVTHEHIKKFEQHPQSAIEPYTHTDLSSNSRLFAFIEGHTSAPWPLHMTKAVQPHSIYDEIIQIIIPCEEIKNPQEKQSNTHRFCVKIQYNSNNKEDPFIISCSNSHWNLTLPYDCTNDHQPLHLWALEEHLVTPKMRKILRMLVNPDFKLPEPHKTTN